jgi:lipoate-protein ligase A
MTPSFRLLPFDTSDGPWQMAADEVMLETASEGTASLRFYAWSPATVSLGYFQAAALPDDDPRLSGVPRVRRATGGQTLVHDREVTYALALPAGAPWQGAEPWSRRMHRVIADGLRGLGVEAWLYEPAADEPFTGFLCFHHFTPGDLLVGPAKVVGSAQRRHRRALLQHGGILLARSPHTPSLPGILDLTGRTLPAGGVAAAVADAFGQETGWTRRDGDWTDAERRRRGELAAEKYSQDWWNRKR